MERTKWKDIKNLIYSKELPNIAPSNIFENARSLTEPQEIGNKYFAKIAADIQSSIRCSKTNFY